MIDPKLIGLARATDDGAMREILASALHDRRPRLSNLRHAVLKHSPGKRCVIEYWLELDGTGEERLIGKLYREPRGAARFGQLKLVHEHAAANGDGQPPLGVPEPLAYIAELGMVLERAVPGTELSRLGPEADWPGAVRAVADNLAILHGLPIAAEPKSLSDHVRKLCRPSPGELMAARPDLADSVENILQALALVDAGGGGRACLVHGDLGLGQVLLAGSRAYFVDLDGLCRSPAALDIANFLVSLRMRMGPSSAELERAFTECYLERRPGESLAELDAYQALAYLRRAAAAFRQGSGPGAHERGERLLAIGNWVARAAMDAAPDPPAAPPGAREGTPGSGS